MKITHRTTTGQRPDHHHRKEGEGRSSAVSKFSLSFAGTLLLGAAVLSSDVVRGSFVLPHLSGIASLCGTLLRVLGFPVAVNANVILSDRLNLEVVEGCDAIYPALLLTAAIVALPIRFLRKIPGILGGSLLLYAVNIIRVLSMYLVGVYFPSMFTAIHLYAWQGLFILLTLGGYLIWARHELNLRTA